MLIIPCGPTKHSNMSYFDTLLQRWSPHLTGHVPRGSVVLHGYLQDHKLIGQRYHEFVESLDWNGYDDISKYDQLHDSVFVHVRGGDYLQPGFRDVHHVDMRQYYKRAIQKCKDAGVRHAYMFTNDAEYAESLNCFDDICITPVQGKNEVHELFLMSQCDQGGISPNSTFAWWGLYLDRKRPHLYVPDQWFRDTTKPTSGYFFPEATILPVAATY